MVLTSLSTFSAKISNDKPKMLDFNDKTINQNIKIGYIINFPNLGYYFIGIKNSDMYFSCFKNTYSNNPAT